MATNKLGYMRTYTQQKREKVLAALGGRCLICSSTDNLEIHHIFGYDGEKHRGRGKTVRIVDWQRNIGKLAVLCHDHHTEYHLMYPDEVNRETLLDYILYKFIENKEWYQIQ